jgi:hypothetical protein
MKKYWPIILIAILAIIGWGTWPTGQMQQVVVKEYDTLTIYQVDTLTQTKWRTVRDTQLVIRYQLQTDTLIQLDSLIQIDRADLLEQTKIYSIQTDSIQADIVVSAIAINKPFYLALSDSIQIRHLTVQWPISQPLINQPNFSKPRLGLVANAGLMLGPDGQVRPGLGLGFGILLWSPDRK